MRFRPSPDLFAGPPPRPTYRLSTSPTELLHLTLAFLVLTVDIALVRNQINVYASPTGVTLGITGFVDGLGVAALAALTGFVAHELAHKLVAQRYGFWAEFRISPAGLLFSIATALFGFLFALPGATMIGGMGNTREWGRTSVAGPVVNLAAGGAFLVGSALSARFDPNAFLWTSVTFLAFVNGVFAAFNLLPFGPLDGRKVLRWSRTVWIATFGLALLFVGTVLTVLLFSPPSLT